MRTQTCKRCGLTQWTTNIQHARSFYAEHLGHGDFTQDGGFLDPILLRMVSG